MTKTENDELELHDRQVRAVTKAVAKLVERLGPDGFTPEAIFEGALRGAAAMMLATRPVSTDDVAELFEDFGEAFRGLDGDSANQSH